MGCQTNCLGALAAAEGSGVSTVVSKTCLLGARHGRMSMEGCGTGFLWFSSHLWSHCGWYRGLGLCFHAGDWTLPPHLAEVRLCALHLQ